MWWKCLLLLLLCLTYGGCAGLLMDIASPIQAEFAAKQLDDVSFQQVNLTNRLIEVAYGIGWLFIAIITFFTFKTELTRIADKFNSGSK